MINNGGRDATLVGMISQAKANALSSGTTTSNVPEGTNLYFTSTRARSVLSAVDPIRYTPATGVIDLNVKWDDLRTPASGINPVGASSPPTFDTTDGSLLFAKGNVVAMWFQLPHGWKEGTDIKPHLHWSKTTTNTGLPNWQIKYKWCNAGDIMPAFTSLFGGSEAVTNSNTVDKHSIFSFGSISSTGKLISSMLCVYLQRTNDASDTYADDAKLLEFDIHYQIDSTGSTQEFVK